MELPLWRCDTHQIKSFLHKPPSPTPRLFINPQTPKPNKQTAPSRGPNAFLATLPAHAWNGACSHSAVRLPFGPFQKISLLKWGLGLGAWGLGLGVWELGAWGLGVWGLGFGSLGLGVWGLGFGVWGLGCQGSGLRSGIWDLGCRRGSRRGACCEEKPALQQTRTLDC